jgi:hypothetical protein
LWSWSAADHSLVVAEVREEIVRYKFPVVVNMKVAV